MFCDNWLLCIGYSNEDVSMSNNFELKQLNNKPYCYIHFNLVGILRFWFWLKLQLRKPPKHINLRPEMNFSNFFMVSSIIRYSHILDCLRHFWATYLFHRWDKTVSFNFTSYHLKLFLSFCVSQTSCRK